MSPLGTGTALDPQPSLGGHTQSKGRLLPTQGPVWWDRPCPSAASLGGPWACSREHKKAGVCNGLHVNTTKTGTRTAHTLRECGTHPAHTEGPCSQPRTGTARWRHHSSRGQRYSCRGGCSRAPSARCHRLQQNQAVLWSPGGSAGQLGRGQEGPVPLWQLRPVHPGAQLQRPVAGWQCPSLAQEHLIWQPGPNQPAGQAAGVERVSVAAQHGPLAPSHRRGQISAALTVLAAAANEARKAQAGSRLGLAAATVFTWTADLLAAQPPVALGTV